MKTKRLRIRKLSLIRNASSRPASRRLLLPLTHFDVVSLSFFSIFYGLDWVATGPPTFALVNEVFGRRDAPVVVSWIFAGHQVGGALAAFGAGAVRSVTGQYLLAFVASGIACLLASLLVLHVSPRRIGGDNESVLAE